LEILAKPGCGEFVFFGLKIKDWPHDMAFHVSSRVLNLLESRPETDRATARNMLAFFDEAFTKFLDRENEERRQVPMMTDEVIGCDVDGARADAVDKYGVDSDVFFKWIKDGQRKSITIDALIEKIDKVLDAIELHEKRSGNKDVD